MSSRAGDWRPGRHDRRVGQRAVADRSIAPLQGGPAAVAQVPHGGHPGGQLLGQRPLDHPVQFGVAVAGQPLQGAVVAVAAEVDVGVDQPGQQGGAGELDDGQPSGRGAVPGSIPTMRPPSVRARAPPGRPARRRMPIPLGWPASRPPHSRPAVVTATARRCIAVSTTSSRRCRNDGHPGRRLQVRVLQRAGAGCPLGPGSPPPLIARLAGVMDATVIRDSAQPKEQARW